MSGFYVFYFYSSHVVVVILPSCLPTEYTLYSTLVGANCYKCAFINTFDLLTYLLKILLVHGFTSSRRNRNTHIWTCYQRKTGDGI